jgi:hypothetical protein
VQSTFAKLEIPTTADDHRRVLAVLTFHRGEKEGTNAPIVEESSVMRPTPQIGMQGRG